jgi:hypothetical protein
MSRPLLVTALLDGVLAGDAPRLDGLLEAMMSPHQGKGRPGSKVDRNFPAPPQAEIEIPLLRRRLGPWVVGACSDPIYPEPRSEGVEHVCKRIAPELAPLLAPTALRKITTSNSWTKSYRLPLRIRLIDRVAWFAVADRRPLLKVLRRVDALGKKASIGYGRVREWRIEDVAGDYSWYLPTETGPVLMATLPAGDWLPSMLTGFRRGFGAAAPPYWHPDRYTEIVVPC